MRIDYRILSLALAVLCAPVMADPPNQPNLPDSFDSDNGRYRLRYNNDAGSVHYVPDALIVGAADALDRTGSEQNGNPRGYHDGYLDLGFAAPWFSGDPALNDVTFWDCDDPPNPTAFDCDNGFATVDQIVMPAPTYRARSESCVRMILGHELFHHVEFGYVDAGGGSGCGKVFGTTVCEGQARAMQDKIYFDIDLDPAASCIASFNGEATKYLNDPDLTLWNAGYGAALFWTYLMEQYGDLNTEPGRGADFIKTWWDLAGDEVADPNVYDITRRTIQQFAPGESVVNSYQDFTIANLVKDLNVLALPVPSRVRYTYADDSAVLGQNNLQKITKVDVDFFANVPANGAASIELLAQRFGGDYSSFDLSACPAGREVEFSVSPQFLLPLDPNAQTPAPDALVSLVLTKGADGRTPSKLYKWRAQSVKKSFMQPDFQPYTRGLVIVSGWHGSYPGVLRMRCLPAPLVPVLSLKGNQGNPGPGATPVGSIGVALPPGATGAGSVAGLGVGDFSLQIGTQPAPIRAVVREGNGYRLHFMHPPLSGPGPFAVSVHAGAQTTTLANAIRYDQPDAEVVVVLDLSASMGQPAGVPLLLPAVQKVREAAARMRSTARFGLVVHFGNGSEPNRDATVMLPLAPLSSAQRASLESVLSGLVVSTNANGAPGDGVLSALDQFASNGGNGPREILLIGDGAQGEGDSLVNVIAAMAPTRSGLTAVALGGRSDQPMFQALARAGGGDYHYVPTSAAGVDRDALDLAFDAVQSAQTREHVLLARQTPVPAGATVNESFLVDPAVVDPIGGASFSAMVRNPGSPLPNSIRLFRPDGSEVLAGGSGVLIVDTSRGRTFQLSSAPVGLWQMQIVGGSAAPTGAMDLRLMVGEGRGPGARISFARPGNDEAGIDTFRLGEPVDIHYATYKLTNVLISSLTATVERPDGSAISLPLQRRLDGDGFGAGETAVFSARLDAQTLGSATGIIDGATGPLQRGSYRVLVEAHYGDAAAGLLQTSTASFAVLADTNDADSDGLPDRYEAAHVCLDAAGATIGAGADPDGDGLSTSSERNRGSDPCSVDSDEGGETDGSEVAAGGNPLDPADDALAAISDAGIITTLSGHETYEPLPPLAHSIRFDSDPRYDQIVLKRAPDADGPFADIAIVDAHAAHGRILDAGLAAGQTYCYQLLPRTTGGRSGAASEIFCGTARSDMSAPNGSIVLEEGAAQTRNDVLTARIALDNESPVGAQMKVLLPDDTDTGWIPFQTSYLVPTTGQGRPASILVGVQLRDAAGNVSDAFADDILLIDGDAAGDIRGSVRGNGAPLDHAVVEVLDAATLAPALSSAGGDFLLSDLPPGSYTLVFTHPGFQDAVRSGLVVVGGNDLDIGIVELQPESTLLFSNGFE